VPLDHLLVELRDQGQDSLRVIMERMVRGLVEVEVRAVIAAGRHELSEERVTYRNGHRPRTLGTRVGRLQLEIPKLRQGSFLRSLLEPRRRIERDLWAVIQEAYVHWVSTSKVDDLVAAMGGCQVSKTEVSRICQELDRELAEFRERPLDAARYPYIWFGATYEQVRMGARIVGQAVVIAVGVRESGEKCVLGVDAGASESQQFWLEFCRSLLARGAGGAAGDLSRPCRAEAGAGPVLPRGPAGSGARPTSY
jgi:transposase-like protein